MEKFDFKDYMFMLFVFLMISFVCFLSFRISENALKITREYKQERISE